MLVKYLSAKRVDVDETDSDVGKATDSIQERAKTAYVLSTVIDSDYDRSCKTSGQ